MENIINDKDVVFIDEKGYIHRIDIANIIGMGAQGAVYRGENKNILIKINQQVGFRLVTKFGQKGLVNVIKMMPLVGGVVGGVFDTGMTLTIGNIAKKLFSE